VNSRIGVRGLSAMALVLAFVMALLAVPAIMPVSLARDATPGIDPATLYAHVHFIGASASAGFEVRAPIARRRQGWLEEMTLANVALNARIAAGAVTGDATRLFFTNPIAVGTAQVGGALAENPKATLVVADDFLFWFCYGALGADRTPIRDEAQRLALLDKGLEQLDRVVAAGIPLVVGDLPDMQAAVLRHLENADRQDITPMERALSFSAQLEARVFPTQESLAAALNVSKGQVTKMVKAAQLLALAPIASLFKDRSLVPVEQAYKLAALLDRPGAKDVVLQAAKNLSRREEEGGRDPRAVLKLLLASLDQSRSGLVTPSPLAQSMSVAGTS
jgi:hypothetical protein